MGRGIADVKVVVEALGNGVIGLLNVGKQPERY